MTNADKPQGDGKARTPTERGAELIRLLGEQLRLYEQLAGLADVQHSLIAGSEPEKLLGILGDRQKLIEQLERLASAVRSHHQGWPELRAQLPAEQVEQIDRLLQQVNRVLAGILERDKADAQVLAARKEVTSQAMRKCNTGRQVGAAYAATAYQPPSNVEWTDE